MYVAVITVCTVYLWLFNKYKSQSLLQPAWFCAAAITAFLALLFACVCISRDMLWLICPVLIVAAVILNAGRWCKKLTPLN